MSVALLLNNGVVLVLCAYIMLPLGLGMRFDRILVTLLVAVLLASQENVLLSYSGAVWLGNCSYAVYLVHWPVFLLHKYANLGQYGNGASFAGERPVCTRLT